MDIALFDELQEDIPKFNEEILSGLAYTGLVNAKADVDQLIRCAEESFPDGFEYLGSEICSPQKAYRVMTGSLSKTDRPTPIDLALSSVYLVQYNFSFDGVPLQPRYFFLPYIEEGGLITITGKRFSISPVLADPCFSVGEDYVFIRMSRAPVTFKRVMNTVKIDGHENSQYIVYSKLHHRGGSSDKKRESDTIYLGRVMTTMPHYLFCRYGVLETFKKFAGADIIITTEQDLRDNPLDPEKYTFISSSKTRPAALKLRVQYERIATPVVLAIPKDRVNRLTVSLANGFFYVLDHYPDERDPVELAQSWHWKVWLGYILWGDQLGHHKLVENVESHLSSLDDYVDLLVRKNLIDEESLDIADIYELFAYMLVEMDGMISSKEEDIATMYGKRLLTSSYVLRDIYEQVFRCLFEITNNRKRKYGVSDYNQTLGKFFSPAKIFDLRNTNKKAFVSSVSTPGDNMYYKITSRLVMQAQTSSAVKSTNVNVNDPMTHLHASTAEAGNYVVLPKSSPLARNTLNPTALLDGKKTIIRKEHMRETVDYIAEALRRN